MYGANDSFAGSICKHCCRFEMNEKRYEEQTNRIRELEKKMEQLLNKGTKNDDEEDTIRYEEQKIRLDELETKLQKIKSAEEETIKSTIEAKEEAWTTIVSKKVDKELKLVSDKVKHVEEKMKIREEEDKQKELKKNNIIIHRMAESPVMEGEKKNGEDRKAIISLINDVLKVPCEDKDIKRIFRLGKIKDTERPLLIEFQEGTMKNTVLENLSKLRQAEEKYRKISVTHDMTKNEREQCRDLVKQCKEKQSTEESGEWIFKVRGPPGAMRIVKMKKY